MRSEEEWDDFFRNSLNASQGHYTAENWQKMQTLLNATKATSTLFGWTRLNHLSAFFGAVACISVYVASELPESPKMSLSKSEALPSVAGVSQKKNYYLASTANLPYKQGTKPEDSSGQSTIAEHLPETTSDASNRTSELALHVSPYPADEGDHSENLYALGLSPATSTQSNPENSPLLQENQASIAGTNGQQAEAINLASLIPIQARLIQEYTETGIMPGVQQKPSATEPILIGKKIMPVSWSYLLQGGLAKPWGQNKKTSFHKYDLAAQANLISGKRMHFIFQGGISLQNQLNLQKEFYLYTYEYTLIKTPVVLTITELVTTHAQVGAGYRILPNTRAEGTIGIEYILNTKARMETTAQNIPLPEGNWGYLDGIKRRDFTAQIRLEQAISNQWSLIAGYQAGISHDLTDDAYFKNKSADNFSQFRLGIRYTPPTLLTGK